MEDHLKAYDPPLCAALLAIKEKDLEVHRTTYFITDPSDAVKIAKLQGKEEQLMSELSYLENAKKVKERLDKDIQEEQKRVEVLERDERFLT